MIFADRVFFGGNIWTLDDAQPQASALACLGGRIVAVGSDAKVGALAGPATARIDLGGLTVVPGFHDAHCHLLLFGLSLTEANARDASTVGEVTALVARHVAKKAPGQWLRCGGYNENKLAERRHPSRLDLDPVSPENPVFVVHLSGHMSVANSRALALAGISRETPDPPGGVIVRDAQGEPTGLLKETAQALVKQVLPPYTLAETKAALAAAGRHMAKEGITSAQDAWAGWIAPQEFRAYQESSASGELPQRTRLMLDIERLALEPNAASAEESRFGFAFGLATGFGTERLRLGAMKLFLDGSLIGRTAALSAPYANAPETRGLLIKSPETIEKQVRAAHGGGWQIAMHAIGDRAIEAGLDAVEAVMGADAPGFRPRFEHCGILRPDLIERIRRAGAVIATQPRFFAELGEGFRAALGPERLRLCYPLKSLRGLHVAFSSDRPVVSGAPLLGIAAALLERTESGRPYVPEEAITAEEALRAYTQGSAYSCFEEENLGTLAPGKWADFVVLSEDLLGVAAERVSGITVARTVVGGETVFEG